MSSKKSKGKAQGDGKYFTTKSKGEIHELKQDLNSTNREMVKEAVKKVIAAMTVGKDVSVLFTDVVKSMQTSDIELKKLVYLYIINYARTQPDSAILIVNTFQKDARDPSPLVRALAIRTMGCIRVDKITEYLCEPLRHALKDSDPYVRKTAAICTAKLYDINAELVEEQDFLERLRDMISDPNPMVVANAVAALAEISESSGKDCFHINSDMLNKLLAALGECTEWGQVFLLDALSQYEPSPEDAETMVERVVPRLQHANSAVAMSAVKLIMKFLDHVKNPELVNSIVRTKLPPPLITLLSEQKPEIQFVALRNINLIVEKNGDILAKEVKHFFCKYNDPIYVKMEKLEIMIKLTSVENVEQVLMEFKEYATEVDVEFVRKAVRAIGRCAIKIEKAAQRCIKVLLELIQTKVNYVVQEAIIVIKDIFRRYPNRYESIIADLCENLDRLDEPEAKASMIWIIGEYAARIENAPELLEGFVESFQDEPALVQLQILSAVVKLFLRRPEESQDMVSKVLDLATENSDNPDLRDRGYVYWRLLATDPEAAQTVILADKPIIDDDTYRLDPELLDTLIANISTLSSVYHKPPESFVKGGRTVRLTKSDEKDGSDSDSDSESESESESGSEESGSEESEEEKSAPRGTPASIDILGGLADLSMSGPDIEPSFNAPEVSRRIVLTSAKGKGLQIASAMTRNQGRLYLDMLFQNQTQSTLNNFAIKFNKNFFGITPTAAIIRTDPIPAGGQREIQVPIQLGATDVQAKADFLQVALKTDFGVVYFQDEITAHLLFSEDGALDKSSFLQEWKDLGDDEESASIPAGITGTDAIRNRLEQFNVFTVANRTVPAKGDILYMALTVSGTVVLLELTIGASGVRGVAKSRNADVRKVVLASLAKALA